MLDPAIRKCIQFWQYKAGEILQKDSFTPQDFHEILVGGIIPLTRAGPHYVMVFLKLLGKICEMPELQEEAAKWSRWGRWGLRQFAKTMRGK